MRVLLLKPDEKWLEERRRLGHDRFDEVWDGVMHVVPSPTIVHQRFEAALDRLLYPLVTPLGLEVFRETDIHDPERGSQNYRQPDLAVVSPKDLGDWINGHAELVAEIRSPYDEAYEKIPFYEMCKIPEYWIIDPDTRAFEILVLRRGKYVTATPDANGVVYAPRFALRLAVVDGPKLRITWADGSAEI
jgi:Uma2 family endonuclease